MGSHDIKKILGGELQRAAICRALVNQPDIVFEDEPIGALNSSTTKEVMDIINTLQREGATVIIVTHDAKVACRASRIIYLMDGTVHVELVLGLYEGDEKAKASRQLMMLTEWLQQKGF